MCDKMAISTFIMKMAENYLFLRLQMRAIEMFNRHQFVFLLMFDLFEILQAVRSEQMNFA